MTETKIEITVTGDNAAETINRIAAQVPNGANVEIGASEMSETPTLDHLLEDAVLESASLPQLVNAWVEAMPISPLLVLVICAALFASVYLFERLVGAAWMRKITVGPPNEGEELGSLSHALRWGWRKVVLLVLFYILCRIGISLLTAEPDGEGAELAYITLGSLMLFRSWFLIGSFLMAQNAPERRPTGLTNDEASFVMKRFVIAIAIASIFMLAANVVVDAIDAGSSAIIFGLVMQALSSLVIAVMLISIRVPIGKLFVLGFATDPENPGKILAFIKKFWPFFYALLLGLQYLSETKIILLGGVDAESEALKRSFGAFVIAPFLVAGLKIWGERLREGSDPRKAGRISGLFALLEGALIVGTGVFILYAWNIDPFATDLTGLQRILPGLVSASIVTVIGFSLWRTANAVLTDGKENGDEDGGPPAEEGGTGGSRIETVMPVIRAVAAAFIGTVTVLLALSSLGVQIAPLLAGAGILGLAIGFGAQKVVEDIISGVLYLVEDAFRKGEYIETAQGKGIVEAIMLRSVRLRHHLGAVYTIPYSAMGTIQNHSRDWVTVKLKFEVAPDQDLEKVRKLVKKVGQQLLEDPELEGHKFLMPLKSQGAVALVGANYQIGVKFTTEPGKQFLIRRKALIGIQKAFAENGIEMAAPRVVVESQDPDQVAAAATKALSNQQQAVSAEGAPPGEQA